MIFLDEKMSPTSSYSDASAYLNEQTKLYGLKESMFNRFKHDAGGMEICFESEVAWNELTHRMAVAEFRSLQESQCLNEGFWSTIVEWARKVKEFFIRIWNSIKAWIKNLWQKLTGTTDKDLIKKVQDVASDGEDVDVELYGKDGYGDISSFVSETENAISKAYQTALRIQNASVSGGKDAAKQAYDTIAKQKSDSTYTDRSRVSQRYGTSAGQATFPGTVASDYKQKLKEDTDTILDSIQDKIDDLKDADTSSVSVGSNEIVRGLTDYDKTMKPLIKFLEKKDTIVKKGMKDAEQAEKDAKKAESQTRKDASKPGSGVKTDPDVIKAQINVNIATAVVNICRKLISLAINAAQTAKAHCDHDHEAFRSAAKEFIKSAKKNKKERES